MLEHALERGGRRRRGARRRRRRPRSCRCPRPATRTRRRCRVPARRRRAGRTADGLIPDTPVVLSCQQGRGLLRPGADPLRRRPRRARGRDRGPARHQRRRQVDAAEGRQRAGQGRRRRGAAGRRRPITGEPAETDRPPGPVAHAGRPRRLPDADGGREPPARHLDDPQGPPRRGRGQGAGDRPLPDSAPAGPPAGGQPLGRRAADALAGHGAHGDAQGAHDRRALARPGADRGGPAARGGQAAARRRARRSSWWSSR